MTRKIYLLFAFFLVFSISVNATGITELLNQFPAFSTFNNYLTQTQVATAINAMQSVTVLCVDNDNIAPLLGKPPDVIRKVMGLHAVIDYYDVHKLQNLPDKTTTLNTLYQSSRQAPGQQGMLNATVLTTGTVVIGSVGSSFTHGANLVKSLSAKPYTLSVLQVSTVILPVGLVNGPSPGPPGVGPAPRSNPTPPAASPTIPVIPVMPVPGVPTPALSPTVPVIPVMPVPGMPTPAISPTGPVIPGMPTPAMPPTGPVTPVMPVPGMPTPTTSPTGADIPGMPTPEMNTPAMSPTGALTPGSGKAPSDSPSVTHSGSPSNAPGENPGSPGESPGSPGESPGSPGESPGSPGESPGSPGEAPNNTPADATQGAGTIVQLSLSFSVVVISLTVLQLLAKV